MDQKVCYSFQHSKTPNIDCALKVTWLYSQFSFVCGRLTQTKQTLDLLRLLGPRSLEVAFATPQVCPDVSRVLFRQRENKSQHHLTHFCSLVNSLLWRWVGLYCVYFLGRFSRGQRAILDLHIECRMDSCYSSNGLGWSQNPTMHLFMIGKLLWVNVLCDLSLHC